MGRLFSRLGTKFHRIQAAQELRSSTTYIIHGQCAAHCHTKRADTERLSPSAAAAGTAQSIRITTAIMAMPPRLSNAM